MLNLLKNESHISAEKIVEQENWSIKNCRDYVNKVIDDMKETGEIKALYQDFKLRRQGMWRLVEADIILRDFNMSALQSGLKVFEFIILEAFVWEELLHKDDDY